MTDRRLTIRTEHDHPSLVAAAIEPDNTAEMSTHVEPPDGGRGGSVVTTITRDTAGGLRTTADDYVTNLQVAERTVEETIGSTATVPDEDGGGSPAHGETDGDSRTDSDIDADSDTDNHSDTDDEHDSDTTQP